MTNVRFFDPIAIAHVLPLYKDIRGMFNVQSPENVVVMVVRGHTKRFQNAVYVIEQRVLVNVTLIE